MGAGNSLQDHCEWKETFTNGVWTIKNGELPDDTAISLFTPTKPSKANKSLLRSLTKQLKIIRHPSILHFVAAADEDYVSYLMTERVVPLTSALPSLSALEICAGLQNILEGLAFLHDKVGVCHNNVCVPSVYVCMDGSWRLGGLEHSCKFAKATSAFLSSCKDNRDQDSISPEEKKGQVGTEASSCCARDVFALAVMAETLLEKMEDLGDLTKTFELRIQDECLNEDPKWRPKVQSLLQDRLFTSEFLEMESFLKSIALKSETERQQFFKALIPKLHKLPEGVIGRRLVPLLLARFVLLDQSAVEFVLPSLLTPCTEGKRPDCGYQSGQVTPLLTEPLYQEHVVPRLVKIMSVRDHHIHLLMLHYFRLYVHLIDKEVLEFDVFPQILLGLRDTSGQVVALSLHALAEIVPILGRDTVIGGQSKTFFREALPRSASSVTVEAGANNKLSNVQGVMENVLLKELASHSKENSLKEASALSPDREKKLKERERRREEMKKRREERKQARAKAAETEVQASPVTDDVVQESTESSNPDAALPEVDTPESPDHSKNVVTDTRRSFVFTDSDSDARDDDSKPKVTILYTDEENDDWADLGNNEDYSAISDDIEQELRQMTGTSGISQQSADVMATPLAISNHSPNRSLKLTSKKASSDKSENSTAESKKLSAQSIKPLALNKDKKLTSDKSKAKSQSNTDFYGGAFDIKSIDIKVEKSEDPFDFFADMTPSIETKAKTSTGMMKVEEPIKDLAEEMSGGSKVSFDMEASTAEVEEGAGWGEEEDW